VKYVGLRRMLNLFKPAAENPAGLLSTFEKRPFNKAAR
jgi:hypothetical protein